MSDRRTGQRPGRPKGSLPGLHPNPKTDPIVQRLIQAINACGRTAYDVSLELGNDHKTVSRWNSGYDPHLTRLRRALETVGLTLEVVPINKDN